MEASEATAKDVARLGATLARRRSTRLRPPDLSPGGLPARPEGSALSAFRPSANAEIAHSSELVFFVRSAPEVFSNSGGALTRWHTRTAVANWTHSPRPLNPTCRGFTLMRALSRRLAIPSPCAALNSAARTVRDSRVRLSRSALVGEPAGGRIVDDDRQNTHPTHRWLRDTFTLARLAVPPHGYFGVPSVGRCALDAYEWCTGLSDRRKSSPEFAMKT
jgi:hypothetical protein